MNKKKATESVWDYPRPPDICQFEGLVRVEYQEVVLAECTEAQRVLETSHPPTYYLPPHCVNSKLLFRNDHRSFCEWKGEAHYFDLIYGDQRVTDIAWSYASPRSRFINLKDHLCFYPSRVSACFVDGERVAAQEGDFYGGWITANIQGPFKGGPGTTGW